MLSQKVTRWATRDVPSFLQDHLNAGTGIVHQDVYATPDCDRLRDLGVDDILRVGDVELHEVEPGRVGEGAKALNLLEDSGGGDDLVVSVEGRLNERPAHARGGTGDQPDPGVGVVVEEILGDGHLEWFGGVVSQLRSSYKPVHSSERTQEGNRLVADSDRQTRQLDVV